MIMIMIMVGLLYSGTWRSVVCFQKCLSTKIHGVTHRKAVCLTFIAVRHESHIFKTYCSKNRSHAGVVGIAACYGWGGAGVPTPAEIILIFLLQNVQLGSRPHPSSYPRGNGVLSFQGVKRPGREFDHSSASSAEVLNMWSCSSATPYALMAWKETTLSSHLFS